MLNFFFLRTLLGKVLLKNAWSPVRTTNSKFIFTHTFSPIVYHVW